MIRSMPVKLSGELVEEARQCAKVFHRSLTAQIEHWAAIGRAVESRMPPDALIPLLETPDSTMKISQVAESEQRQRVVEVLSDFLRESPDQQNWLAELGQHGIPVYGTKVGSRDIVRRNSDGTETHVTLSAETTGP